ALRSDCVSCCSWPVTATSSCRFPESDSACPALAGITPSTKPATTAPIHFIILCPHGLPISLGGAIHFIKISSTDSFFCSASLVSGSREAMYPPTAAAARKMNISSESQGLPAARPAKSTSPQVTPKTICAPNATSTAIPDCRLPCIFPNSIFFGNVNEDQLAIVSCPATAKTSAPIVARKMGSGGNPTRHHNNATHTAIS